MGASHSRENLDLPDSDVESEYSEDDYQDAGERTPERSPYSSDSLKSETPSSLNDVEERLKALKLKYPMSSQTTPKTPVPNTSSNAVKLYYFRRGTKSIGKWALSEKLTFYHFIKSFDPEVSGGDEEDEWWFLKVSEDKIRVKIGPDMQLKALKDQRRVDFLCNGVWALKFFDDVGYDTFIAKYEDCLFENTHQCEANEANKIKIYGKDFIGWANPELADDSMWEDADDAFQKTPQADPQNFREEFEEASNLGIQSLALGALQNSFLVGDSGIQVVKNYSDGIHGKGVYVNFGESSNRRTVTSTPKKALLMRGETNMMIMSPSKEGQPHTAGLHQLDIETGKIVTEWKFEKDGTDITMRDITNDSKGAQLDPSGSTFLGLDDNRLCRWDMRDRHGIVQNLDTPALNWTHGHQFSRGTNFQCFASTGDGSIVVGSLDGKIRLYSSNTMRQAKTAFPGLGSPVTHVDVTYDGKWILGTTDTYLILICTLFTDKDGKTKTGFSGRMGSKIAAPRLLKLTPTDSELAGTGKRFQKAQFSWVTENGRQERHLVATVGKFSVIWDFEQVKKSGHECYKSQVGLKSCYCYKIVLKDDAIVESRFMHEKFSASDSPEAPLVIATPMKVSSFSIAPKRSTLSFV